jgi:wyosine [tRNA(Phe)-imidazoG37] synthetase (radical SAM superfamily)
LATQNKEPASFAAHGRNWRNFRLVYPVVSRRSKGLSLGINLNPDRVCNFDCIYCEVARPDFREDVALVRLPPLGIIRPVVDLAQIKLELGELLNQTKTGAIWHEPEFQDVPPALRRLNDIAFSGDGEPTTYPKFAEAVQLASEARTVSGFEATAVKIVLITNATELRRERVKVGLKLLAEPSINGETWAKLDAGTPEYYKLVDKTAFPYERILQNILETSQVQPLNIQTCLMRVDGIGPNVTEIEAYCSRLQFILAQGGQLVKVQLYTVARPPAQLRVSSLPADELDVIAQVIRQKTGLPVETYYGSVGLV